MCPADVRGTPPAKDEGNREGLPSLLLVTVNEISEIIRRNFYAKNSLPINL